MNIRQLLVDGDPTRHWGPPPLSQREALRRRVLAVAGAPDSSTGVSRRALLLAGGVVATGAIAAGAPVWFSNGSAVHAAVTFEVRVADPQPGLETHAVMRSHSGGLVYVREQVSLTNADIASARVVRTESRYGVEVTFTEAGAAKMRAVTSDNIGRLLAVLVDGEVVAAPRVTSAVSGIGILTGDYTRAEAERVAAGLLRRAPR